MLGKNISTVRKKYRTSIRG